MVKASHPNAARLNQLIFEKLRRANDQLLKSEVSDECESVSTIRRRIEKSKKADFFAVADRYLENLLAREKFKLNYRNQKK